MQLRRTPRSNAASLNASRAARRRSNAARPVEISASTCAGCCARSAASCAHSPASCWASACPRATSASCCSATTPDSPKAVARRRPRRRRTHHGANGPRAERRDRNDGGHDAVVLRFKLGPRDLVIQSARIRCASCAASVPPFLVLARRLRPKGNTMKPSQ
ncbi:hypothetical protein M885DRAFT_544194 [Pelagophyceae sp. CCMP2097]|nr:hypothetical protein M885DRAFT_544194 [Pelagophyceae sp. CCMP2097]